MRQYSIVKNEGIGYNVIEICETSNLSEYISTTRFDTEDQAIDYLKKLIKEL
jgi:hypothetical protein